MPNNEINSREVRIGNYFQFERELGGIEYIQVNEIHEHSFYACGDEVFPIENVDGPIEPVKLTPEILEKAGFEHIHEPDKFDKDGDFIKGYFEWSLLGGNFCFHSDENKRIVYGRTPLQYLHQLQNLYFAITGEELEIRL